MRSACKLWAGAMYLNGYGRMPDSTLAHRAAYIQAYGPIPKGLVVRHTCDNKACVNPEHLIIGTQVDNMQDARLRNKIPLGSAANKSKLVDADIPAIRASKESCWHLAKHYSVSHSTIQSIRRNLTWKHVL